MNKLNFGDFRILDVCEDPTTILWKKTIRISMCITKNEKNEPKNFWISITPLGRILIVGKSGLSRRQRSLAYRQLQPYYDFLTKNCSEGHVGKTYPASKHIKTIQTLIDLL